MKTIPDSRLLAVEPIITVIGMTENGDLLVEDRNSRQFSIKRELLNEFPDPTDWREQFDPLSPHFRVVTAEELAAFPPSPPPETAPILKKPRARRKKG